MWISIRDGFQRVVNARKVEHGGSVLRAPIKTLAVLRKSAACGPLDGVLKGALIPIAERKHGETAPSKYVARNCASVGNTGTRAFLRTIGSGTAAEHRPGHQAGVVAILEHHLGLGAVRI